MVQKINIGLNSQMLSVSIFSLPYHHLIELERGKRIRQMIKIRDKGRTVKTVCILIFPTLETVRRLVRARDCAIVSVGGWTSCLRRRYFPAFTRGSEAVVKDGAYL